MSMLVIVPRKPFHAVPVQESACGQLSARLGLCIDLAAAKQNLPSPGAGDFPRQFWLLPPALRSRAGAFSRPSYVAPEPLPPPFKTNVFGPVST